MKDKVSQENNPGLNENKPESKNYVVLLAVMFIIVIVLSLASFTFISKQIPAQKTEEKLVVKSEAEAGILTQRFVQSLREAEATIRDMRNIDFSK